MLVQTGMVTIYFSETLDVWKPPVFGIHSVICSSNLLGLLKGVMEKIVNYFFFVLVFILGSILIHPLALPLVFECTPWPFKKSYKGQGVETFPYEMEQSFMNPIHHQPSPAIINYRVFTGFLHDNN